MKKINHLTRISEEEFNSMRPGTCFQVGNNLWTVMRAHQINGSHRKMIVVIDHRGWIRRAIMLCGTIYDATDDGGKKAIPELNAPGVTVKRSEVIMA